MSNLSLIVFIPLIGFLITGLLGKKLPEMITGWIGSAAVLLSFVLSVIVFNGVASGQVYKETLFTFLSVGSVHVEFGLQADRLTAMMMLVVTGIGFLIHLYSISYMHGDKGFYKFFAYLNLFIFNMLILIMGSNFLMLFFGWEGVGLCSYLLIGFWYTNPNYGKAARKAFVMNRIGDLGLLLGLFLILFHFKTLDYDKVFEQAATAQNTAALTAIAILLFVGAMGKSAQIPLYTWLPDAMAGPTPVSALIHAATMVTAGIYLVVRCHIIYDLAPIAKDLILYIGLATSAVAALIGLKQNDIKKVLAYSTVSQLGLMFVALGVGAYTAAMFHLVTHAFFKALLFLGSGSVIHAMSNEQDIRKMGGLKSKLPITYWTFLIGTLAISGFPFLSGFFSKDEILVSVFAKNPFIYALTMASAGITAFYMFRMFFVTFHGKFRGTHEQEHHLHESPFNMTLPLIVLAILSVIGGWINLPAYLGSAAGNLHHYLAELKEFKILPENQVHISHTTEFVLIAIATLAFVAAWFFMRKKYVINQVVPESDEEMTASAKLLAGKFYVDEVYDAAIVEPINKTGETLYEVVDRKGIDAAVNKTGSIFQSLGKLYSKVQNGNTEYYLLYMVVGIIIVVTYQIFK